MKLCGGEPRRYSVKRIRKLGEHPGVKKTRVLRVQTRSGGEPDDALLRREADIDIDGKTALSPLHYTRIKAPVCRTLKNNVINVFVCPESAGN